MGGKQISRRRKNDIGGWAEGLEVSTERDETVVTTSGTRSQERMRRSGAMSNDIRFAQTAGEVLGGDRTPAQAVTLAVALVTIGAVMLGVGLDIVLENRAGHGIALVALGGTVFLPGAYYCYIAWNAYKKRKGFDWSLMQEM